MQTSSHRKQGWRSFCNTILKLALFSSIPALAVWILSVESIVGVKLILPIFGLICWSVFVVFGWGKSGFYKMLLLLVILLPLELGCGILCFSTIGEVASAGVLFSAFVLNCACLLVFAAGFRNFSMLLAVLLAIAIVPYHSVLGVRWWKVDQEAQKIVLFAYARHVEMGEYPSDLSDYEFHYPETKTLLRYSNRDDGFFLKYYVGSQNTSHWYQAGWDSWFYYPD